jgi:hypothetical protein
VHAVFRAPGNAAILIYFIDAGRQVGVSAADAIRHAIVFP